MATKNSFSAEPRLNNLNRDERFIYATVLAQSIGCLINKGRAKPTATAHRAAEFALAAVQETRIQFPNKHR
jgi:hypothetical protein